MQCSVKQIMHAASTDARTDQGAITVSLISLTRSPRRAMWNAGKAVTIVTSAETLIAGKSPKLGRACHKWLLARGAKARHHQATYQSSALLRSHVIALRRHVLLMGDKCHVITASTAPGAICMVARTSIPLRCAPKAQHVQMM